MGEELALFGTGGRGGDQVAAGLERGVHPAQPGLQLGDAGEVGGPVAAVELGQASEGVGGVGQVAGRLADPGGEGPGGNRAAVGLDRTVGRTDGFREFAVRFAIAGQGGPWFRGGCRAAFQLLPQGLDLRASRPAAWSFFTRDSRIRGFLLVGLGQLSRGGQLALGLVELTEPMGELG